MEFDGLSRWLENPIRKIILISQVIFLLEKTLFEDFSPQLVGSDVSEPSYFSVPYLCPLIKY